MSKIFGGFSAELLRGVASVASLRILGVLIGYAFVLMVARVFGATALGQYQLTIQVIGTCGLISALGFNQLTLKYAARLNTSEEGWRSLRKLCKQWAGIASVAAVASSIILAAFAEDVASQFFGGPEAKQYILLASILVPFQVLTNLACGLFRGIGLISLSEYLRSIHVRVINFLVLGILIVVGGKNVDFVLQSFVVASLSAFALAAVIVLKKFREKHSGGQDASSSHLETLSLNQSLGQSLPMYQSALLIFASTQALVYILAYFENPAEVAKYNVSLQIANLANFIFASVVTVSAPMYSRDFAENRAKLEASIKESSKMIFWASGSASLIIGLLSYPLLLVFGEEFASAWPVLVLLAAANFVNAFTGASGNLLDMTGGHKIRKNILLANAVLTILMAVFAIQEFGVLGVAIGYFFNMCFGNFIGVYVVYRKLGINMMYVPWSRKAVA
ncbi:oligosaccharide flippase family protein [Marinobacter pelagius]|uniref:Membrane protein involved in the export of O-antigen and teichoic acid n=1 Tax=Marinobacter pelagius TaxID=379482 RepID=A0A1I4U1P7_9GAMM|nr:oligosaccharide flippase family protein [Marinobacter pelagius]SFM82809.1 Membrane protein involved in the export of O-antigen and teichoic acid [Marinobacter pelagius]